MDFFNKTLNYGYIFENQETIDELKKITDDIKKYDVYDVLARISGLNLMPHNQNKSVLLDSLITVIICEKENTYNSTYKMSAGRFKKLIGKINETNLACSIDPNENAFYQNVMLTDNYTVFNGIDNSPAYNLQMIIDILFNYENDFPKEYKRKIGSLTMFILRLSEEIARRIGVKECEIVSDEGKYVVIPNNEKVKEYAECVVFDEQRMQVFLKDYPDLLEEIIMPFGSGNVGSMKNRPFYSKPFVKNSKNNSIILLNISLLPNFLFFQTLKIASEFGIKNKVVNRYNDYVWRDCRKSLEALGHHKLKESTLGIELMDNAYHKECIVNVYNNQLMLTAFICDDACDYSESTMHAEYPNEKHTLLFEERMNYFWKKMQENAVERNDIYCLFIISGFGRGIGLRAAKNLSKYKALQLNPFELHCISVNERKKENFLPRYIRAKEKINTQMPNLFSELNAISIYTSNKYSFYLDDDFNPHNTKLLIAPGDSVDYINQSIRNEGTILIDSYEDGWKTKVVLCDEMRNMYTEGCIMETKKSTLCIRYNNCVIWITSEEIKEMADVNLNFSIMDTISYWLAECKDIIEDMELLNTLYHFSIILEGDKKAYYYAPTEDIAVSDLIRIERKGRHYNLTWTPKAYSQMSCKTNAKEKELCQMLLDILNNDAYESEDYADKLDELFDNPMRRKIFSLDFQDKPYYKPILFTTNRRVREEDEDYLLDIIGKSILQSGKWTYGVIPDEKRTMIANEVVGMLYKMLQEEIAVLSSEHLVEAIYVDLEEVLYKQMLAKKNYAYELSCYPEKENEYVKEYNDLNRVSLALKFMMEYVAAKPPKGEVILGIGKYEYILAICSLIIEWAYKNDLFYYNIFNAPVEILKSDRIGVKQDEFYTIFQYGDKYRREELYYNSSSDFRKKYTLNQEDYSGDLDVAFQAEYGYSFTQFYRLIMGMIEYGNEREEEEVYKASKQKLIEYIVQIDEKISNEIAIAILKDISLTERDDFLKLPSGFRKEDVYPWRFNRAYSFSRRPVIIRKDMIIWGNRQLYHMLMYVTDLIYEGKISTKNAKMSTLIGRISDDRGRIFNKLISDILTDMEVFVIDSNVDKINKKYVADKNGNTLGDIDVLIIDNEMHHIYVAEVKDFNFSRNPYEIQLEYQKMFVDGKKKCYATKHSRRVDWVKEHLEDLKIHYQLSDVKWNVYGLFIVSEPLISTQVYNQKLEVISRAELSVKRIRSIK